MVERTAGELSGERIVRVLAAYDEAERTALALRNLTATTSTAGALKAVERCPTPELLDLRARYDTAVCDLIGATGGTSLENAREIARQIRRRVDRLAQRQSRRRLVGPLTSR